MIQKVRSTTQTVQFWAWLTILLDVLPKKNSSLPEGSLRRRFRHHDPSIENRPFHG